MSLTIEGVDKHISWAEAEGLAKCFTEYAKNHQCVVINSLGWDSGNGTLYMELGSGVTLKSQMGREVVVVTGLHSWETKGDYELCTFCGEETGDCECYLNDEGDEI
jgi:hypothetical protein